MHQLTLFHPGPPPEKSAFPWDRIPGPGDSVCGAQWIHRASGWRVYHCGHPTALWPYAILRADGSPVVGTFSRLAWAMTELIKVWEQERAETT